MTDAELHALVARARAALPSLPDPCELPLTALRLCVVWLGRVRLGKSRVSSYACKHMVEKMDGEYQGYVGQDALIAAAVGLGFAFDNDGEQLLMNARDVRRNDWRFGRPEGGR